MPIQRECRRCGATFFIRPSAFKRRPNAGLYCSRECRAACWISPTKGRKRTDGEKRKIALAHTGLKHTRAAKKRMSLAKKGYYLGSKNPKWAGGRILNGGYEYILQRDHPYADRHGYVATHRLVMERHLGRRLGPEEVVHHKNRNRTDNRIANLQLCASNSEHMKIHASEDGDR